MRTSDVCKFSIQEWSRDKNSKFCKFKTAELRPPSFLKIVFWLHISESPVNTKFGTKKLSLY